MTFKNYLLFLIIRDTERVIDIYYSFIDFTLVVITRFLSIQLQYTILKGVLLGQLILSRQSVAVPLCLTHILKFNIDCFANE